MFPRWNRVILQYFAGQQSERQVIICIDAWFTVECFGTSPKCETSCGGKQSNMANWVLSVVGIGARSPACSKKHQSILFIWADGGESLARLEASCNGTGRFQDSNHFRCQVHPSHVANQSWKTCTLKLHNVRLYARANVVRQRQVSFVVTGGGRLDPNIQPLLLAIGQFREIGRFKTLIETWQIDLTLCSFRRESWCQHASSLGLDVVLVRVKIIFLLFLLQANSHQKSPNKVLVP